MGLRNYRVPSTLLLAIALTSCAGIRTKNFKKQTPTQAIKNFKAETKQLYSHSNTQSVYEEDFLPDLDHELVRKWERYFTTKGKMGFQTFLNNGEKYRPMIERIFAEHNLPKSLYYVGLIESGYIVRARSHASAVGPWQFIKGTAKRYGLKINRSIDERQNIYKSTQAAALYFQDLYNIFGSWELALSAYNAGEYGIIRRIRGANTRDYYKLSAMKKLPKETRNYVPKVIAAMKVAKRAREHKIKVTAPKVNPYLTTTSHKINGSIGVNQLANQLSISPTTLRQLNADIKGSYIPNMGRAGFYVYLPKNRNYDFSNIKTSKRVSQKLSKRSREVASTNSFEKHIVRKNETLSSISKRYNVTMRTLRKLNKIKGSRIYIGQKLNLPRLSTKTIVNHSYTVRKGDHLTKIANIFNTRAHNLKKMNKLSRGTIYPGQKLKVPAHKRKYHIVKRGEALIRIAKKYNKQLAEIKDLNNMKRGTIYPGQKILVELVNI